MWKIIVACQLFYFKIQEKDNSSTCIKRRESAFLKLLALSTLNYS